MSVPLHVFGSKSVRAAIFAAIAIVLFAANSVPAQQAAGRILGTVVDSTGAAVADAQITITSQDTAAIRTVASGSDGAYSVPQLPAGPYTVDATAAGFSRAQAKNVEVTVASDTRLDLKLQVGSVAQTVEVTGVAPLVDTTSSSLGGVVDEQRVADLPLNGRNWTDLTLMQPGVAQVQMTALSGNAVLAGYNGMSFISNGATDRSNNYLLDGAPMVNFGGLNNSSMSNTALGVDGIKEYKVVTNLASAEYGMRMGSTTTIVSKSGTNAFHGDAFDYLRNSALDARNIFDPLDTTNINKFGTNKSLVFPGKRIPPFQRNGYGGSIGGPIRKDKTFFELVYEGIAQNWAGNAGQPILLNTLPLGCFVDNNNVLQPKVPTSINNNPATNPYSTTVSGVLTACSPPIIAGGVQTNLTLNAHGAAGGVGSLITFPWAELYPQPNILGSTQATNFSFPYMQPTTENYGQMRIDHSFSASNNAFVRYTHDDSDSTSSAAFPGFVTARHSASQFATIAEDHIFSPNLLNSIKMSYSRTVIATNPRDEAPAVVNTNCPGAGCNQLVVGDKTIGDVIGGVTPASGITALGTGATFSIATQEVYAFSDDLFWTKGKHALKFGYLINHFLYYPLLIQGGPGSLTFANLNDFFGESVTTAQLAATGLKYATYGSELPGVATNGLQFANNTFGVYAQDDYRILPRVTLNLGLRWETATPLKERYADLRCSYRLPSNTTCVPGNIFKNNTLRDFSPRIGFAWDVFGTGKTSLRGGAGIFYDIGSYGFLMYSNVQQTPPLVTFLSVSNSLVAPINKLTIPLPTTGQIQTPRVQDYNMQQPTLGQWNLQIQQQLPWGMAVTLGYVGSRGWHLYQVREGNPVLPLNGTLPLSASSVTQGVLPNSNALPVYGCWSVAQPNPPAAVAGVPTVAGANGGCATGTTWQNGPRVYSNSTAFGTESFYQAAGDSYYHAAQLQVTKRTTHGFQFQASYTLAKHLDDAQGLSANESAGGLNQFPLGFPENYDRGPSVFDIRHNFRLNLLYRAPNLTSRAFLGKFVNGWGFSSIASANTGIPITPSISDRCLCSATSEHPDLGPSFDPKKAVTGLVSGWIDPTQFSLPIAGHLGTAGRGILRGPGQVSFDFSVVKDNKVKFLGEAGNIEFRAEMFNILNHANLGLPASTAVWTATAGNTALGIANQPAGQIQTPSASATIPFTNSANGLNPTSITSTANQSRQIQLALKVMF